MLPSFNVLGGDLETCSTDPLTGWFRDGCCNTDRSDQGLHTVCCVVTEEFLDFARSRGNDLITPSPQHGFPGLEPGGAFARRRGRMLLTGESPAQSS